tara:strand:- start:1566 stop:2639 length:1074 start_codon:yes stop_codon:yes gene_type:complete
MNYKVMKRPMFKLGGKAASQGTGITSGLDQKVNMAIGGGVIQGDNFGAREGFQQPDYTGKTVEELMNIRQQNMNKAMSGIDDMRDIVRLQTLGNLATNVLPNIESGGLRAVTDFFKDPMTTQSAIGGLTGLKQIDLKEKELQGKGLDQLITGKLALDKLDISRAAANKKTATEIKNDMALKAEGLKGIDGVVPVEKRPEYERLMKIALGSGFITQQEAKRFAIMQVTNSKAYEEGELRGDRFQKEVERIASSLYYFQDAEPNAEGGRVGRAMGTPMTGEQPMAVERKDVAMETEGQGNDAYAILRARLPQEIPDEVVKLIAYNKQAFADFASIKNQEDVTSFNQKYNVSMNIDVSTV